jgi:hypothetical protein
MNQNQDLNNIITENLTRSFIETKEFQLVINSFLPGILDAWSGDSRLRKLAAKSVKGSIKKNFNWEKQGSLSVAKLLKDPEIIKNIFSTIPVVINLLMESFLAMSQCIEKMKEEEKIDLLDNVIDNIQPGKSAIILTNMLKVINDVHAKDPNYFEKKIRPKFKLWIENFDFGELKESMQNSTDDIVEIVSLVNHELWNYPGKILSLISLIPTVTNIILKSINKSLEPVNDLPPDLIADVILSLLDEIDGAAPGEIINHVNELIRKIHTGSALIGEMGNPRFPIALKKILSKMFEKINIELHLKSREKLEELKEQFQQAYIQVLSDDPALSRKFIHAKFNVISTYSKKIRLGTNSMEKLFNDEELAEEFSLAASRIDTGDLADNISSFCSLLNRVHDERPGLLKETLSRIISSLDDYEISESVKWITQDIVESVKPVSSEILPPLIRGLADLLSSDDKKNQEEIFDAINYFKEKVNFQGAKS